MKISNTKNISYSKLSLWTKFNRSPFDYALVKTSWLNKFRVTVTKLMKSNFTTWTCSQKYSKEFGESKTNLIENSITGKHLVWASRIKWKIQLWFGKKLSKKSIRMSSLSYLSRNLQSSRQCWHGARKSNCFDNKTLQAICSLFSFHKFFLRGSLERFMLS